MRRSTIACAMLLFNHLLLSDLAWRCSAAAASAVAAAMGQHPCQPDEAFYFNIQPKGITVPEGSRAFLECNVSNSCNVHFHWVLSDSIVVNTTRRYQNGSNLVITRVNRSLDSGEFHCIATIAATGLAKQSQPAALAILWISESASVTALSLAEIRGELQLRCEAEGHDEPTYRWFHNGRRLKRSDRCSWRGRRLTVQSISVLDNGVYSCEAENAAGVVRSSANFVLTLPSANGPDPKLTPVDVVAKLGGSARFDCRFDRAADVYWRKVDDDSADDDGDGRIGIVDHRLRQLENNSLLIDDVSTDDEGSYECVARGHRLADDDGSTLQALVQRFAARLTLATLSDFQPASFEPVRDVYVVGQGKRFQVACIPAVGRPVPEVYWRRNGVRIATEGRVRVVDDYSLIIDSARPDDRGEYVCTADNLAGTKWTSLLVHVSKVPVVERHPFSMEVDEGSDAQMDCTFRGNDYPVTVVQWEKDQMPLGHATGGRRRHFADNGTLLIAGVTMADAGEYTCLLKTHEQHTVYSQPAVLKVRERLKFLPRPVDRKLELHSDARIPCRATGFAPAKVKWMQVGRLDTVSGNVVRFDQPVTQFPSHVRDKDGVLYFHRTTFEDSGLYACLAVSSQGVINVTIKVEVIVAPVFDLVPANVTTVDEDEDVWLHCSVRGTPQPTVQWYFEGVPDTEWTFPFRKFSNNTLVLLKPTMQQAGKYNCMAGNKGGFKRHEGLVCIRLRPSNISHCGRHVGLQRSVSQSAAAAVVVVDSTSSSPQQGGASITATTVAIACGAGVGYILLVIALVSYCGYRRRRGAAAAGGKASTGTAASSSGATPLQLQSRVLLRDDGIVASSNMHTTATNRDLLLPPAPNNRHGGSLLSSDAKEQMKFVGRIDRYQYCPQQLGYLNTTGYCMDGGGAYLVAAGDRPQADDDDDDLPPTLPELHAGGSCFRR